MKMSDRKSRNNYSEQNPTVLTGGRYRGAEWLVLRDKLLSTRAGFSGRYCLNNERNCGI